MRFRLPPPIVVALLAVMMYGVSRLFPSLWFRNPWREVIGWSLIPLAAVISMVAAVTFRLARTTVNPMHPERASALVVHGIYRFTRNPMYVGLVLLLVAVAVLLSNVAAFLGAPLFVLAMNRFQISAEERALEDRFGEEYREFRRRVRRWI